MIRLFFISFLALVCSLGFAQNIILSEDFESNSGHNPPSQWQVDIITGVYALDSFYFSDTLYDFSEDFLNNYALFDSYIAGQNRGTNANGAGEEVALVSPSFSTKNLNNLYLSFDYNLQIFASSSFAVDVSTDGIFWTNLWSTNRSTPSTKQQTVNLQNYLGNSSCYFRLRWLNPSNLPNQGYLAIDNVLLYEEKPVDVSIDKLLQPQQFECSKTSQDITVKVSNRGTTALSSVPVKVEITGDAIGTLHDTIASLPVGGSVEILMGQVSTSNSGSYMVKASSVVAGDSVVNNNVLTDSIHVSPKPSDPLSSQFSRCGTGQVLLSSVPAQGEIALWYDSVLGTTMLSFEDDWLSPVISSSRSYYVEHAVKREHTYNSFQGPWRFNGNPTGGSYLDLEAHEDLIIDSIEQHCAYADSNVVVKVYSRIGSYLGNERDITAWDLIHEDTVSTLGWGKNLIIDIDDIYMSAGEKLAFYITVEGGASPTFKNLTLDESTSQIDIKSDAINGLAFANPRSGYSWDGKIHFKTFCKSTRIEMKAVIIPRPSGADLVKGNLFEGIYNTGNAQDPDVTTVDSHMSYEIIPPSGYNNSDYGVKWTIDTVILHSNSALIPSSDSSFKLPNGTSNAVFSYMPSEGWDDETVEISIVIRSLESACDTILKRIIYVAPIPELKFEVNDACSNETVLFVNHSTIEKGFINVTWYFGDGDSSDQWHTGHKYNSHGVYQVRLKAVSDQGVLKDTTFNVTIHEIPEVDLEVANACEGTALQFTNKSQFSSGSLNFKWYFGDGDSSELKHPTHLYSEGGEYQVTLEVGADRCSNSKTIKAYQFFKPKADFEHVGHCSDQEVQFTDLSSIGGDNGAGGKWYMEASGPLLTGKEPVYVYKTHGTKEVTFISISQFNCTDTVVKQIEIDESPSAAMSYDFSCDQTPTQFTNLSTTPSWGVTTYNWDFGDNNSSSQIHPLHQFSDLGLTTVTLTASHENGCVDLASKEIAVKRQPVADFEAIDACSGDEISFVNKTYNTFGTIHFRWEFGDGDTSDHYAPRHTYEVPEYSIISVKLRATSSNGCFTEKTQSIQIGIDPECGFTFEQSAADRQVFSFHANESNAAKYTWLFDGDGTSDQRSPIHKFTYPDEEYKVTLIVENDLGCTCSYEEKLLSSWGLSIDSFDVLKPISIWPNPTSDQVAINNPLNENLTLTLITLSGQTVIQSELSQGKHVIDLDNLPAATYIIRLQSSTAVYNYRLHVIK